ncbi:CcmD family protein [Mailhella massiliensis]|uniref:CcmD family protein n=1 Tax=Mailhella massiliensis TaxID=1903261 RepID=A0A921DQW5_9BACT|nr:CcmD family protein [Mailhella massiliensis]HJD96995.1 CcmD family protein [Mailhella massiliensis]
MTAFDWLMAANAALWIGLGAYMAFLASEQKRLERRMAQWEADHD